MSELVPEYGLGRVVEELKRAGQEVVVVEFVLG